MAIDPICGMKVDETSALSSERDGKTVYFCSDDCRQKFLSVPAEATPEESTSDDHDSHSPAPVPREPPTTKAGSPAAKPLYTCQCILKLSRTQPVLAQNAAWRWNRKRDLRDEKITGLETLEASTVKLQEDGKTVMYVAIDGQPAGILSVADPIKPSTAEAIEELHALDLKIVMLTGDNHRTATAVAMQSAGITLVKGDLRGIAKAIRLSRATMWNIRQNLLFALATTPWAFLWRPGRCTHFSACCSAPSLPVPL